MFEFTRLDSRIQTPEQRLGHHAQRHVRGGAANDVQ
jgi:hypothetical protein